MELTPKILLATVMHKRLFPKVNQFRYRVYYVFFSLFQKNQLADGWRFGVNRRALLSFYDIDHGDRDRSNLEDWMKNFIKKYELEKFTREIILVCMPRVLGYVFNPISFYLCLDENQKLRAVLCEVNNTFGESHLYLCAHPDFRIIESSDWLEANKSFHVSPFLERSGFYRFCFSLNILEHFSAAIHYYDADANLQLITSLSGKLVACNRTTYRKVFWSYPLVTLKTIVMIHWQAFKLLSKKLRFFRKPKLVDVNVTVTRQLGKSQ